MGDTPCISAGGWDDKNCLKTVEDGQYDALAFAKWFASTPDLPERLKNGRALEPYDRSRFYGGWDGRPKGYIDYPFWETSSLNKDSAESKKRKASEDKAAVADDSANSTLDAKKEPSKSPKKKKKISV
jgi:hypothetical protein